MTLEQPAPPASPPRAAALDERYLLERGHVFLSGVQALVRLPLDQARRDRRRLVLDVARVPDLVRGYEDVELRGVERAERQAELLMQQLEGGSRPLSVL